MAFTYLKVKSTKCLCLFPVVLVLVLVLLICSLSWSCKQRILVLVFVLRICSCLHHCSCNHRFTHTVTIIAAVCLSVSNPSCRISEQETQLSLTNRATQLCKCSGIADLLNHAVPHMCSHAEFGHSALSGIIVINTVQEYPKTARS